MPVVKGVYDIVIAGGGPGGLAAGLYAMRTGRTVALLEQLGLGGQAVTTWRIDNYPGLPHINGAELAMKFEAQVQEFGLEIITTALQSFEPGTIITLKTTQGEMKTKSLILTLGANPKKIGIPGEEKYRGKGVSYCATCDGAFFRDKPVAVIGGGNTALEEALFLTRFASRVFLIHRRKEFRADKILQKEVLHNPKIEILTPYISLEMQGNENEILFLLLRNSETKQPYKLEVKGVFIFAGLLPQTEPFRDLLECDKDGYIITNINLQTSIPGIYAAGDCRANAVKQIIVAAGEGAMAAIMADRYLSAF